MKKQKLKGSEEKKKTSESSNEKQTYILTIDDYYRVRAENEKEARQELKRRIGSEGYEVYHINVQKVTK